MLEPGTEALCQPQLYLLTNIVLMREHVRPDAVGLGAERNLLSAFGEEHITCLSIWGLGEEELRMGIVHVFHFLCSLHHDGLTLRIRFGCTSSARNHQHGDLKDQDDKRRHFRDLRLSCRLLEGSSIFRA